MKFVLDEMVPAVIAEQLRRRGVDAIAAVEPAHAGRYAGMRYELVSARSRKTAGRS